MQEFVNPLADLGDKLTKLTTEIGMKAFGNPMSRRRRRGGLPARLRPPGVRLLFARMAKIALEKQDSGDPFLRPSSPRRASTFAKLLPETASLIRSCRAGPWRR